MKKAGKLEELPFNYREALKDGGIFLLDDHDSMILIAEIPDKEMAKQYYQSLSRMLKIKL